MKATEAIIAINNLLVTMDAATNKNTSATYAERRKATRALDRQRNNLAALMAAYIPDDAAKKLWQV